MLNGDMAERETRLISSTMMSPTYQLLQPTTKRRRSIPPIKLLTRFIMEEVLERGGVDPPFAC